MNAARMNPTRAANVTLYESARQALSAAVMVDQVKDVLDRSAALVEYARCAAGPRAGSGSQGQ
jgi:hypothetical protein